MCFPSLSFNYKKLCFIKTTFIRSSYILSYTLTECIGMIMFLFVIDKSQYHPAELYFKCNKFKLNTTNFSQIYYLIKYNELN